MISLRKDQPLVVSAADREARTQLKKAIDLLETPNPDNQGLEEVVHQVRKRIKKTRAFLKLVRDSVGKKRVAKVDQRLQNASRSFSSVRDASALLMVLDRLERRSIGLVPSEPFQVLREILNERKAEIHRVVLDEEKALMTVTKLLRSALRRINDWDPQEHRSGSKSGIDRAYRRGRDAYKKARAEPSSDRLHDLRKRAKSLGYQLNIQGTEAPSKPGTRLRMLCRLLANELGEGHDLDLLRESLEGQNVAESLVKALDRRRTDLRQGALQRAGVIFQTRPKALLRSLTEVAAVH